jgi:signal transduction histidine kinase
VVPILVSGRLWGFIGFDDCVSERAWDRSEVRSLQLAAGLIGGALERRETQAQQERMEAALRQQQRLDSIGTLAGGVAHEINNPINGVMNYAQLLKDRFPNESMALAICDGIIEESERIATITRDLLQFARREERGHSRARVIDLVNGTLNLIRTVFRHERIQLEVSVPSHLPEIICRTQQIQQVIMNLLTNARDAVNTPGLECDRRVLLSAVCVEAPDRRLVRITVEDSGPGIPVEAREQLYDPFFTTKQGRGGTGLGLAICHGIVRDHHGQLWFETELGRFTRFHLDLPVGIPPYSRPIDTCNAPGESLLETPTS